MPDSSGNLVAVNTEAQSTTPTRSKKKFSNHVNKNGKKYCPDCHGAIPHRGECPCGKSSGKLIYTDN